MRAHGPLSHSRRDPLIPSFYKTFCLGLPPREPMVHGNTTARPFLSAVFSFRFDTQEEKEWRAGAFEFVDLSFFPALHDTPSGTREKECKFFFLKKYLSPFPIHSLPCMLACACKWDQQKKGSIVKQVPVRYWGKNRFVLLFFFLAHHRGKGQVQNRECQHKGSTPAVRMRVQRRPPPWRARLTQK